MKNKIRLLVRILNPNNLNLAFGLAKIQEEYVNNLNKSFRVEYVNNSNTSFKAPDFSIACGPSPSFDGNSLS